MTPARRDKKYWGCNDQLINKVVNESGFVIRVRHVSKDGGKPFYSVHNDLLEHDCWGCYTASSARTTFTNHVNLNARIIEKLKAI